MKPYNELKEEYTPGGIATIYLIVFIKFAFRAGLFLTMCYLAYAFAKQGRIEASLLVGIAYLLALLVDKKPTT
jgi:hypothetical protein